MYGMFYEERMNNTKIFDPILLITIFFMYVPFIVNSIKKPVS